MNSYIEQENGVVPAVCSLDCPDQCGLLLHKEEGRIVKVTGDPEHPVTRGNICNKVRKMTDRLYDPERLQYPMRRIGAKGERRFERISWDEAIQTIAERWKALVAEHGSESILPYSYYGNMGNITAEGMDRRFFNRLGASLLDQTICNAAGAAGYRYTMGGSYGTDPETMDQTKLFIMWGINTVSTNMHQVSIAEQARKQGAKVVVIDVHKNQTGRWADWFVPIQPGTDTMLALGIMHLLFAEGLTDDAFLAAYTVGVEELREHVKTYTPARVSEVTGVPEADIRELARLYGETTPSCIRIGNGLQHHDNGGMCIRAIACLPALTGQWQYPGGGALKGNSGFLAFDAAALQRPDLRSNPNARVINMNQIGRALLQAEAPIRSMFVYGSNPAVVAPDSEKVQQGLEREDLFTVVHDLFLTETAAYADIVLPATSSYENTDFYTSYWHHYIQLQQPVIQPYGESKSNTEVFRLLARAMGYDEPELQASDAELIGAALDDAPNPYIEEVTYDRLAERGYMRANRSEPLFPGKLPTPSGKIELYSKRMLADGHPPLPTYVPLPLDEEPYPLRFIPGPNHNFLNSTFSNNATHQKLEKQPRVFLHPADAEPRGIASGDKVRLWNHRGECVLEAVVGDQVVQGAVVSQGLWSAEPGTKRLVNALTPDRLSDMGGGATFFSGRVEVERIQAP
ncbi:molybdopterin-containing oxidoreductase family protein [Paenibacillus daejeonensis]|uniref:molybdopterin-containing oxidoreductase family protein n=1 Tax=Paenibacillus daejeonensis TaxID=135193 RepID=UPI000381ABCB|nr:molybdopterin oxidoreductase family protein [Paenibacillus daejeonensis]